MGPFGEDPAAPQQSTSDPDAGWNGGRPEERSAWSTESPKTTSALMDLCHLKNSELEPTFQKYKGRVVLRGDIVKTILGLMRYSLNKDHQHHK